MTPDEYLEQESRRLEVKYAQGDHIALIEVTTLFMAQDPPRAPPPWAKDPILKNLRDHFNSGAGQGQRGKPGPKAATTGFDRRMARARMFEQFRHALKHKVVSALAEALNQQRRAAGLPAIDWAAEPQNAGSLASAFLRGGPAQASRKTCEAAFYATARMRDR